MRSPRRPLRGTLVTGVVSLALALSAVLVPPDPPAPVAASSYSGYTQGQVMATYDKISYPAMAAPKLKDNAATVALAAYKGPLLVHANLNDAAVPSGLGLEWQCVELVQRYFYGKGWTTVPTWTWKDSAAADMPTGIPKNGNGYPEATFDKIGSLLVAPRAGDILVFGKVTGSWNTGHVALITGVSSTRVTFIEQNVSLKGLGPIARDQVAITKRGSGLGAKFTIASTSLEHPSLTYPTVLGWIHAVKNTGTAPAAAVLVPAAPAVPTGFTAIGTGPGRITSTWVSAAVSGDTYEVAMVSSPGVHTPSDPMGSRITGTAFTMAGLTAGQRYCFDIRAVNVNGTSDWAAPGDAGCATADVETGITGVLRDVNGKPVGDMTVYAAAVANGAPGGWTEWANAVQTDRLGRFVIPLPAGAYYVAVIDPYDTSWPSGWASATGVLGEGPSLRTAVSVTGNGLTTVTMSFPQLRWITGRVVATGSTPVTALHIYAGGVSPGDLGDGQDPLGPDGSFRFPVLPGSYELTLQRWQTINGFPTEEFYSDGPTVTVQGTDVTELVIKAP